MIRTYQKGVKVQITWHFASTEFDCKCTRPECTTTLVDDDLPTALEALRNYTGELLLTRGFSCEAHNTELGGAPHSKHLLGIAADLKSKMGLSGLDIANAANKVDRFAMGGIGYGLAGGAKPNLCHCDVRTNGKARWNYH